MKPSPPLFDLDGFETFWSAYPRKECKLQAKRAWSKLRPVPDALKIEAIRTWVEAASMSEQWRDRRFIPHAATVINQRRWDDDPPPMKPRPPGYNPAPTSAVGPPCGQDAGHALGVCGCQEKRNG